MRKIILIPVLLFFINSFSQEIVGKWKAKSDKTGEVNSILEIYEINGEFNAKIIAIPNKNNTICYDCKGKYHNKNIIGLVILTKLTKDENSYENGKIMDPENAKTYSCYVELKSPNKLKIRGYIGFSIFGRTQYWYRLDKNEEKELDQAINNNKTK